ncbi:MAG: hypothetical protein JJE47_05550 [Acidimicrobiia bacterium]|nr:hypothetical protein [Acidimicrobiia bacterium]
MILGYLDPGTGSLIIQTVLGGAAGLAVLFRSTRRRFADRKTPPGAATTEESASELAEQEIES